MSRILTPLLALFLAACCLLPGAGLVNMPMPVAHTGACCWQALQQVQIDYRDRQWSGQAIMARSAKSLRLVLIDPLGRRLVTVTQDGTGITTQLAPGVADDFPVEPIMKLSLLTWLPGASLAAMQTHGWTLAEGYDTRELRHRGKPEATVYYQRPSGLPLTQVFYSPERRPLADEAEAHLTLPSIDLTIVSRTLTWEVF